jgi:endonuclease III
MEPKVREERMALDNKKKNLGSKAGTARSAKASAKASAKISPKTAKAKKNSLPKTKSVVMANQKSTTQPKIKGTAHSIAANNFKQQTKAIAQQEMDLLCRQYPDADCELDFESTYQLITSVILSAQTTDSNVNRVTPKLFKRFPTAKSLAEADLDEIKGLIKSTGYYNAKAKNIQNCAKAIVENFSGEVPKTMEELITLPGVGRKTANVVLGVAYNVPGWTVDTHVQRLSKRLGLTNNLDPEKIEYDLQKLFPGQDWSKLSITLIWHGRRLCVARNPDCRHCPINHLCPSAQI